MSKQPQFILLNPLRPSYFGYNDGEVTRMVNELEACGIKTLMVDTGQELFLYAQSQYLKRLEDLCTSYDLGGIVVESTAVYDQAIIAELV